MIRAHLATFPLRRRILRRVVDAIVPQVDQLFIVLNEYQDIPGYLAKNDKITTVIPDRDVKDAGKFWFTPDPDDLVFLIDDDIGYPPDYVARTLESIARMDGAKHIFGYFGGGYQDGKWTVYPFNKPLAEITGATMVGTGTAIAYGRALPPLSEVEPCAGYVDYAWGDWLCQNGFMPWVLPRPEQWITEDLPKNLKDSSLLRTVAKKRYPHVTAKLGKFARGFPHANIPYDIYRQGAV
ncbi:MAG: hypothetical protein Q4F71_07595 [Paracoccus sp. (in: a-proteobacteria)]|nr:hypothetical protein [Paracoccus sp. (in: a-proteobacteria)]